MSVDGARGAAVTVAGRVEWMDTDAAGIHHNSAITRFPKAAEEELARGLGLDGYFEAAPRARYEVTYEAPLFFGQPVGTVLYVERGGMSSLTSVFEVWVRSSTAAPEHVRRKGSTSRCTCREVSEQRAMARTGRGTAGTPPGRPAGPTLSRPDAEAVVGPGSAPWPR